jgi:HD-GYP domain-containing protein (c-di-GMP phosphodiesterase class II)
LVELHKKTPVPRIAVSLLEMAYTVLTPKTLSTFKERFFNDTISKPKGWDTLRSMVWENFERSIQKNRTTKSIQKKNPVSKDQMGASKKEAAQQISVTREKSVDATQQETDDSIFAKNATIQLTEEGSSNSTDITQPSVEIQEEPTAETEISNSKKETKQESILANEQSKEASNQEFGIGTSVKDMDEETREAFTPQTVENLQAKVQQASEGSVSKDQPAASKKGLETTKKTSEEQPTVTSPTTKISPVRQPIPSNTPQFWQEVWNKRVAALRKKAKKSLPEPIPVQPKEPRKILPTGIPTEETQEIYIHNAGMVICASYIPKLFQVLAWVKDNTFIDELSVQKALLLGHYLVTGEVEAVEHQLPLVKLLCGLPINTPFVTGISLSKEEQARADELLRALIKHWPKIGTVRIQSFRNSFLKREGKLSNQGQQWTLQVEQRPFDMVLQTLPWNIRMIKTSLMHELLLVEWPY